MKRSPAFVLIAMLLLCALAASCNKDVEDMLDDYNGGFTPVSTSYTIETDKSDEVYEPGDSEFKEDDMLYPIYKVSQNSTLNLAAPSNCTSYRWTMTDPDDEFQTELRIKTMTGSTSTTKKYVLYVPQSGLYANKTFKLTLKVHGADGYDYTDVCGIAVYKDYYFSSNSSRSILPPTSEEAAEPVSSRMILPESYSVSDSRLRYYLYAKNEIAEEAYGPAEISVGADELDGSGKTGSLLIELPQSDYYLALFCCIAGEADTRSLELLKASAVLSAYANADLRYDRNVVFYMNSKDVTYPGTVALKIFTDGWSLSDSAYSAYSVSARLMEYTNSGGSIEATSEAANCSYHLQLSNLNITAGTAPSAANFVAGIAAGTYLLNITFSSGTKTFTWSDGIVILAGKTTEAAIGLPLIIEGGGG